MAGVDCNLMVFRQVTHDLERKKLSATLEQLVRFHKRMPVLVYERVLKSRYLYLIERYGNELRFVGKRYVLSILLTGLSGYWYLVGTKYV